MKKSKLVTVVPNLKVKVTQKHIANGEPHDGDSCPIALALKQQGFRGVDVNYDSATFMDGDFTVYLTLPKVAQKFVSSFDEEEEVKPFEFTGKVDVEQY